MKRYGRFLENVSHHGRSPHGDGRVGQAGVLFGREQAGRPANSVTVYF